MKIQIEIDESEIKALIVERVASKCVEMIWSDSEDFNLPYEKREAAIRKRRQEILDKIDWKNAASLLSETVVKKFFSKLLDEK